MTWDPDELHEAVLGEFADHAIATEAEVRDQMEARRACRNVSRHAPGYKAMKQREYRERERLAPISNETRELLWLAQLRRRGMREKLQKTRAGLTLHFAILTRASDDMQVEGEQPRLIEVDGYVTTGVYENGALGEFFVRVGKGATQFGPAIDRWAEAVSIGLQYGAPVDTIVGKSVATRDEICGVVTGVVGIKRCTSAHDLIARWLLSKYGTEETKKKLVEVQP